MYPIRQSCFTIGTEISDDLVLQTSQKALRIVPITDHLIKRRLHRCVMKVGLLPFPKLIIGLNRSQERSEVIGIIE